MQIVIERKQISWGNEVRQGQRKDKKAWDGKPAKVRMQSSYICCQEAEELVKVRIVSKKYDVRSKRFRRRFELGRHQAPYSASLLSSIVPLSESTEEASCSAPKLHWGEINS